MHTQTVNALSHDHVYLGAAHETHEQRTRWKPKMIESAIFISGASVRDSTRRLWRSSPPIRVSRNTTRLAFGICPGWRT